MIGVREWEAPCTVEPILTSTQPGDLSNYSLFLRADRADYQCVEKERCFFSGALCLERREASSTYTFSNLTHIFSLLPVLLSGIEFLKSSVGIPARKCFCV